MQPRLWGYTVSLPKNILMGLWQNVLPAFFFVQSCPAGGKAHRPFFFAADAAPRPGGTAPASIRTVPPHPVPDRQRPAPSDLVRMRPPRDPSARPLSRAQSALRAGPPPWRWPARPRRWRAGPAKVCGRSGAGRAGTGPARPPPPHRSGPALSGPGPGALAAVGVGWWLAAGRPARGRPASGLVAGRLGAGGRSPPAGALCRGGGGPVAGCGRLGVGLAALPAPVPRLRLTRPPPTGTPPAARRRGGAGAGPRPRPVVLLGAGPGRRSGGQRPPGPAPFPTPGRGGTMPPGRRGFGAPLRAAARRPPMRGAGVWIPPPAGGGGRQRGGRVCAGNPEGCPAR